MDDRGAILVVRGGGGARQGQTSCGVLMGTHGAVAPSASFAFEIHQILCLFNQFYLGVHSPGKSSEVILLITRVISMVY